MEKCANERRTAKREERKDHEKRALAESLVQDTAAVERAPKSIPHENEKAAGDDGRKREGR